MKKSAKLKPLIKDKAAPKEVLIRIEATTTPAAPKAWGTLKASPRIFSTGGAGYNLTGRVTNPASGETYLFSGNLVLAGSTPKKAKK